MLSCKCCVIFKNPYFEEHLQTATSEVMLVRGMTLSSHFSHFLLIQPFQDIGLRGIFKREYNQSKNHVGDFEEHKTFY